MEKTFIVVVSNGSFDMTTKEGFIAFRGSFAECEDFTDNNSCPKGFVIIEE